ncbi:MAG: macro domain-containing protein [Clostridia bacterium]|nr:macro domain-containing protein [Clostridia bacterium]
MPFFYVQRDITGMQVDAIVNAANNSLLGGGGVDGAIHAAAGSGLLEECAKLGGCRTGEAKRTGAYRLPCRYVIHTVGPVWHGGTCGEPELLAACYRNSLQIAADSACESVAFPLISAGVYGYPKAQAIRVAVDTIGAFLQQHDMTVYLVLYDSGAIGAIAERFGALRQWLGDALQVPPAARAASGASGWKMGLMKPRRKNSVQAQQSDDERDSTYACEDAVCDNADMDAHEASYALRPLASVPALTLDDMLTQLDESFAQMLFRKIDERGMTDAQCYKKANIDRKLFSKIRSNPQYRPSKTTALAFAVALELPLDETRELLGKAGYALSHSYRADLIVEYFIRSGVYDVMRINEALFAFDQTLLGA